MSRGLHRSEDDCKRRFLSRILKLDNGCWELARFCGENKPLRYGYRKVTVVDEGGVSKYIFAHRYSYYLFHGPIPAGLVIMHKCDNRECVNPDHIEAATQSVNMLDASAKGRLNRRGRKGEENNLAKLISAQVLEIRKLAAMGVPDVELSRMFGVSATNINDIKHRKIWKHI